MFDIIEFLKSVQKNHKNWEKKNFPNNKPYHSILGMQEEYYELLTSLTFEERFDAVCDIFIYLIGFANSQSIDMYDAYKVYLNQLYEEIILNSPKSKNGFSMPPSSFSIWIGKISRGLLKKEQNIRINEDHNKNIYLAVGGLIYWVRNTLDKEFGKSFDSLKKVFDEVTKRNWVKYPKDGVN